MKKIFIGVVLICFSTMLFAGNPPKITFDKTAHNFGKVKEMGGVVTTEFKFTNDGDSPLVIVRSYISCTCTKISYPKKPITKGGHGVIKVTFDPKKQSGTFMKPIQIFSNATTKKDIITITGEVINDL